MKRSAIWVYTVLCVAWAFGFLGLTYYAEHLGYRSPHRPDPQTGQIVAHKFHSEIVYIRPQDESLVSYGFPAVFVTMFILGYAGKKVAGLKLQTMMPAGRKPG